MAATDLRALVRRMADRSAPRTEATIQSSIHSLLLLAPLGLEDADLQMIELEAPVGLRRRIDIEVGFTVIEVKKDLRVGTVRDEAVAQLAGYVRSRSEALGQRYVGVLTDGAEWELYHLSSDGQLALLTSHVVTAVEPDVEALSVWLEGVLATSQRIVPTPEEIARRLGAKVRRRRGREARRAAE